MEMNVPQQIFAIFFAIFWGTSSNAWPKWKPFHWPLFPHSRQVRYRTGLSVLVLNVLPLFYFVWAYSWLGSKECKFVGLAVVPAFAVFGFYRLWIGLVECKPESFYHRNDEIKAAFAPRDVRGVKPDEYIEPTIESLCLKEWGAGPNIGFACMYLGIATLPILWLIISAAL